MSSCTRRNPTAVQLLCPAKCKPTPPTKGAGLEDSSEGAQLLHGYQPGYG